ncbi:lipoprotein NlpI [Alkalimonas delamerensis]|uniref:Lipoprotein NlpI n=1 Tax=Alkalimonas delamerensis TaxID=265981 RepID=A0ABT9GS78_9GAMM|nr:lipoprotein NlpI [Alkalimonas delamerensis]MDP4529828.1 lipoprotein NlpI [Alkalimonas delamerensis]
MPNRMPWRALAAACLLLGLSGCASQHSHPSPYWLTPEPLPVQQRTEVAIARLTEILHRAELTEPQLAQLHYDRGVMYESVGLTVLARFDFMRALRLQPDLAGAYNFMGIHYTLAGNFEQAYEAFDSVLELDPSYEFAYLNRALALYYAGRIDLSLYDFVEFQQRESTDPYRAVWLYLAAAELDPEQARAQLLLQREELDESNWGTWLADFFLGSINESELLLSVSQDLTSPRQLAERLCEAYFYLAKWHSMQGDAERAMQNFKLSLATNVFEFLEHRFARLELARLRDEPLSAEDGFF